jgi:hypothetical protein
MDDSGSQSHYNRKSKQTYEKQRTEQEQTGQEFSHVIDRQYGEQENRDRYPLHGRACSALWYFEGAGIERPDPSVSPSSIPTPPSVRSQPNQADHNVRVTRNREEYVVWNEIASMPLQRQAKCPERDSLDCPVFAC